MTEFRPKTIVIVRHGETVWNKIAKAYRTREMKELPEYLKGVPNPKTWLSEEGRAQATATGKKLAELYGSFDAVFFSPWLRTTETINLILKEFPVDALAKLDGNRFAELLLTEQNPGDLDPCITDDIEEEHRRYKHYREMSHEHGPFYLQCYNVESWAQVGVRTYLHLQRFNQERYHEKKLLLVTHGITTLMLRYNLEGLSEQQLMEIFKADHPHNCGVYEYRWNAVTWRYDLERCNETFY